jgi:hypothetical protein
MSKRFKSVKNMNLQELWDRMYERPTPRNYRLLLAVIAKRIAVAGGSNTCHIAVENGRKANKFYESILSELWRRMYSNKSLD